MWHLSSPSIVTYRHHPIAPIQYIGSKAARSIAGVPYRPLMARPLSIVEHAGRQRWQCRSLPNKCVGIGRKTLSIPVRSKLQLTLVLPVTWCQHISHILKLTVCNWRDIECSHFIIRYCPVPVILTLPLPPMLPLLPPKPTHAALQQSVNTADKHPPIIRIKPIVRPDKICYIPSSPPCISFIFLLEN